MDDGMMRFMIRSDVDDEYEYEDEDDLAPFFFLCFLSEAGGETS